MNEELRKAIDSQFNNEFHRGYKQARIDTFSGANNKNPKWFAKKLATGVILGIAIIFICLFLYTKIAG